MQVWRQQMFGPFFLLLLFQTIIKTAWINSLTFLPASVPQGHGLPGPLRADLSAAQLPARPRSAVRLRHRGGQQTLQGPPLGAGRLQHALPRPVHGRGGRFEHEHDPAGQRGVGLSTVVV